MALIYNGLLLMVIGMGTVFAFLSIMVLCIQASSRITSKFAHLLPEKEPARRKKPKPAAKAPSPSDDAVLIAVMSAAISKYRSEQR